MIEESRNICLIVLYKDGMGINGINSETKQWRVFTLSAKDESAVRAMAANLRRYLKVANI